MIACQLKAHERQTERSNQKHWHCLESNRFPIRWSSCRSLVPRDVCSTRDNVPYLLTVPPVLTSTMQKISHPCHDDKNQSLSLSFAVIKTYWRVLDLLLLPVWNEEERHWHVVQIDTITSIDCFFFLGSIDNDNDTLAWSDWDQYMDVGCVVDWKSIAGLTRSLCYSFLQSINWNHRRETSAFLWIFSRSTHWNMLSISPVIRYYFLWVTVVNIQSVNLNVGWWLPEQVAIRCV